MKAVLCKEYGPPEMLVMEEVPALKAGKGEVVIQVKACGVNFPDTLIIQGKYQFKPPLPFSPGSDVAGIVTQVGEGVKRLKVGDEVVAMLLNGGFAEEVIAPAKVCVPKPKQMSFVHAASFMMVYGTSYHALKDRANLQAGETLLVLGASGGVGLTAVELGKVMGARVIAAASTDEKLALCKEYGADELINYTTEDLKNRVKALTGGKGADVVYDPVGGPYSNPALRATGWKGRFLVVGFATGEIPKIPLNLALLKGCQIVGVFRGAFARKEPRKNMANMAQLIEWFVDGTVKPHIHAIYSLEETPQAIRSLMDRKVRGKVVVKVK